MKSITKSTLIATFAAMTLAACGGGGGGNSNASGNNGSSAANYTVSGAVTGLNGGVLVLNNNGGDAITVNANGSFAFPTTMSGNASYSVTVASQPRGQMCTVSNASGAGMVSNVSNVAVICSTISYSVAGVVSGLAAGQRVTLQNNGADAQTISANGSFAFATPVAANGSYAITVTSNPAGQVCTVSNGSGSGVTANVNNVAVTCSTDTYTISGTVSGLAANEQVTLLNNGAEPQIVTANGAFSFAVPVVFNSSYAVTVGTQPTGQACTVSNATGAGVVANIGNVAVQCSTSKYTVSGTVSGLASGQQVSLNDNGSDALTINANGNFSFATPIAFNGSYAVTVGTQPTGQICTVTNATGAGMVANISNVTVNCATTTYTISGTIVGLNANQQVTLLNNGANPITVTGSGSFTFTTPVVAGGNYLVTVGTQPTMQTCTPFYSSGGPVKGNITSVVLACSMDVLQISGSVSGLNSGEQVTLNLNGASPLTLTANGAFSFGNAIVSGSNYTVTVGTQPVGETCIVSNGSGSNAMSNIGNVGVACSASTETVLYSFQPGVGSSADAQLPFGSIVQGTDGNFYGTTTDGGAHGDGAVFKITPAGTESRLWSFAGGSDGVVPFSGLTTGSDGNFYGMTANGGTYGHGIIYKLTPSGTETVLYSFGAVTNDGNQPRGSLTLGSDGSFYGMTNLGGANGNGVVFKITPAGSYTLLYSFGTGSDAQNPVGTLVQYTDGNFYGVTNSGGTNGHGAMFMITPSGTESVLYSFGSSGDGTSPSDQLQIGADGNFYGTCSTGGANGHGTVFKITPGGTETTLYSFGSGTDGQQPISSPLLAPDGNFYGVTYAGGTHGDGTIYKITPTGTETVLWSFGGSGDGEWPTSGLILGSDGHFYGITNGGGSGMGTLFRY